MTTTTTTKYTAKIGSLALADEMTLSEALEASWRDNIDLLTLWRDGVKIWHIICGSRANRFQPNNLGVLSCQEFSEWSDALVGCQWKQDGWHAVSEFHRHAADAMASCILTLTLTGALAPSPEDKEDARRLAKAVRSVRRWQEEGLANE